MKEQLKKVSTMDIMMGRYKITKSSATASSKASSTSDPSQKTKNPQNPDSTSLKKSLDIQSKPSSSSIMEDSPDKDENANQAPPTETERSTGNQITT